MLKTDQKKRGFSGKFKKKQTRAEALAYLRSIQELTLPTALDEKNEYFYRLLIDIGQAQLFDAISIPFSSSLLQDLEEIDFFYHEIGGILGYQKLVEQKLEANPKIIEDEVFPPQMISIEDQSPLIKKSIETGLENLPKLCEIYVVGGAADRLGWFDLETKTPLPAASFSFLGKTLLQYLVEDLIAREYAYFKVYGKKVITPICLMTSHETNNHKKMVELLEKQNYFGRPKETFFFIKQPMVPVVDKKGKWIVDQGKIVLKPSGHGALWTAGLKKNVFQLLKNQNREYGLVRQINNLIIGVDENLLAFYGLGIEKKKNFGFFVTQRIQGNSEGVVVCQIKKEDKKKIVTNIEYCQIESIQLSNEFPANTNLLFFHLDGIETAIQKLPFPGTLLNFKSFQDAAGSARIELTMQNLAEAFDDDDLDPKLEHQQVFLAYQEREKAISTIKRLENRHGCWDETPQQVFYDRYQMIDTLLRRACGSQLPEKSDEIEEFLKSPPFFFFYHPALGPSFKEIGRKVQKLKIKSGSWIDLNIAECSIRDLVVKGALEVRSRSLTGQKEASICDFSHHPSRLIIQNSEIENEGIFQETWQAKPLSLPKLKQCCKIEIGYDALLIFLDTEIKGDQFIQVPDSQIIVYQKDQISCYPIHRKQEILTQLAIDYETCSLR